jgi:hypothetical protein
MAERAALDLSWHWVWIVPLAILLPVLPLLLWRGHRLTYLACVCGLLTVSVCVLWCRNWRAEEGVGLRVAADDGHQHIEWQPFVVSRVDGIALGMSRDEREAPQSKRHNTGSLGWRRERLDPGSSRYLPVESRFAGWGFQWMEEYSHGGPDSWSVRIRAVRIPTWCVILLLSPPVVIKLRVMLHQKKIRRWIEEGRCAKCGYDLRAHEVGQKCPECGFSVPPRAGTASSPDGTHLDATPAP